MIMEGIQVSETHPEICWPAPGAPALIEEAQKTWSFIATHRCGETVDYHGWLRQICLRSPDGEITVPLQLIDTQAITRDLIPSRVRGFASLPEAGQRSFVECRVKVPDGTRPNLPGRSRVFDLWNADRCLRRRCVALTRFADQRLAVAFASDFHLSCLWDQIIGEIGRTTPDLMTRLVNPSALWERFVEAVNQRWRRGELDLVVLGGDLVDHVHLQDWFPREADLSAETNVHRFLNALSALMPPVFVIPGNHDFRLFPWRPRIYGLGAIGLTKSETRRVLRESNLGAGGPPRPRDLCALQTRDAMGRTALAHHLRLLAPSTDYAIDVAGMRLIFASTGCDALVDWINLGKQRPIQFLRSLSSAWKTPDSVGFDDEQIGWITDALQNTRGAAVFFHAPLLHVDNDPETGNRLNSLPPFPWSLSRDSSRVERLWQRAGLRKGVSFSHAGKLLESFLAAPIPVTTFSGHIHRATRIDLSRADRRMSVRPLSSPIEPAVSIQLLTGPAVGQADLDGTVAPGYLLANFDKGYLTDLRQENLPFL